MKRIEKTLMLGSGYTILILTLFYVFANIAQLEKTSIGLPRFLIILGFGMLISTAELIYELLSARRVVKNLIHYFLLLFAFSTIFIFGDFYNEKGLTAVLISVILFTVMYFLILGIVIGVRRTVSYADQKLDKHTSGKKAAESKTESKYTPKFK